MLRSTWTPSGWGAVTGENTPTPPSMVHGYVWLSLNSGDMRDGGSLGKNSMLPSVPLRAATGDESPMLVPWLAA
jgi:hypothetical protein